MNLKWADLLVAEKFLFEDSCRDPVRAHAIVKAIFNGGERNYPTLWRRVELYVQGAEFAVIEGLSSCPGGASLVAPACEMAS